MSLRNAEVAIEHVRNHLPYAATKKQLVKACSRMKEFSQESRDWFKRSLPEGTYNRPEEVLEELRM